jgi:hypothetical protein
LFAAENEIGVCPKEKIEMKRKNSKNKFFKICLS